MVSPSIGEVILLPFPFSKPEFRISPARKGAGQSVSDQQRIRKPARGIQTGNRVLIRQRAANRTPLGPRPSGRGLNETQVPIFPGILCQVTSNPYGDPLAHPIRDSDFERGGLRKESAARPGKLFTASSSLMTRSVGRLNAAARQRLLTAVVAMFKVDDAGI